MDEIAGYRSWRAKDSGCESYLAVAAKNAIPGSRPGEACPPVARGSGNDDLHSAVECPVKVSRPN